jgi:hypothetical protein
MRKGFACEATQIFLTLEGLNRDDCQRRSDVPSPRCRSGSESRRRCATLQPASIRAAVDGEHQHLERRRASSDGCSSPLDHGRSPRVFVILVMGGERHGGERSDRRARSENVGAVPAFVFRANGTWLGTRSPRLHAGRGWQHQGSDLVASFAGRAREASCGTHPQCSSVATVDCLTARENEGR